MSELKTRLRSDLTTAMKARDAMTTGTLRMVLAAVGNEEVAGKSARELSDAEVVTVLTREAKKRRESADAFAQAGRDELAAKERAEGDIIARYLPEQLSDDEIADIIRAAIAETGAEGPRAMGSVMRVVQPKVAGRADGAKVAAEVKRQLAG
jgi:uncharacterized protein YqeY